MKINITTFLILLCMAGSCLAQGMGPNGASTSSGSSSMGNGNTRGDTNINSENAQDNSETGAIGNTENNNY